jgi:hypothetical protein
LNVDARILLPIVRPESQSLDSSEMLEAPPGFEPGIEVLQSHPRSFSYDPRPGIGPEVARSHCGTRISARRASCVALVEIGQDRFAAGTSAGTPHAVSNVSNMEAAGDASGITR